MTRRKFLKTSVFFGITPLFARIKDRVVFPPKEPLEFYYLKSKSSQFKVMLIGEIYKNKIGAYKAARMLVDATLKKGELLIVSKSNFASSFADIEGYDIDFSKKYLDELIKEAILDYKPDVVISMYDNYGFNMENKKISEQNIVIDEMKYKNFNLYTEAKFVIDHANIFLKRKLGLINTKTFSANIYNDQKNSLTAWCLENGIKAFCINLDLPSLEDEIKTYLVILREFFTLYNVEVEKLNEMIKNPII